MRKGLEPKDFRDNRAEPRTAIARLIDILPCQATAQWKFISAEITDCSLHGIALILNDPMSVGQQFLVKLRLPSGVRLLLYTVHNCTPMEKAKHRVGARFSGFAAQEMDEDLQKVLEALVKGAA
jgi:hypothetical protein